MRVDRSNPYCQPQGSPQQNDRASTDEKHPNTKKEVRSQIKTSGKKLTAGAKKLHQQTAGAQEAAATDEKLTAGAKKLHPQTAGAQEAAATDEKDSDIACLHRAEMKAWCHSINEHIAKSSVSLELAATSAVDGVLAHARREKFELEMASVLESIARRVLSDDTQLAALPSRLIYKVERELGLFQVEQTQADGKKAMIIQVAERTAGVLAPHCAKLLVWLSSAGAEKAQLQAARSLMLCQ